MRSKCLCCHKVWRIQLNVWERPALALRSRSLQHPYLSEVQHAGAEGRGWTEQRLDEASAQLEPFSHAPHVGFLQQTKEHKSEVHPPHHPKVHVLIQTHTHNKHTKVSYASCCRTGNPKHTTCFENVRKELWGRAGQHVVIKTMYSGPSLLHGLFFADSLYRVSSK